MKAVLIFLALALCASADPWANFARAIQKYQAGTLDLQSFKTQADCDPDAAFAAVAAKEGILGCLLTIPSRTGYPECPPPNQAAYAGFCPTCKDAMSDAVTIIAGMGCTYAQLAPAIPVDCTEDADCMDSEDGPMCSMTGNCGAWCNVTNPCQSCSLQCMGEVCTDVGSGMMSLPNDVLSYNGQVMCSKNADGVYCYGLQQAMMMPSCADLEASGCCAGLLVETSLTCNENMSDMQRAMLEGWKTNCTMVDFTQTCGLKAPADCCGVDNICGPGGAAFGVAPAAITFVLMLAKFFL